MSWVILTNSFHVVYTFFKWSPFVATLTVYYWLAVGFNWFQPKMNMQTLQTFFRCVIHYMNNLCGFCQSSIGIRGCILEHPILTSCWKSSPLCSDEGVCSPGWLSALWRHCSWNRVQRCNSLDPFNQRGKLNHFSGKRFKTLFSLESRKHRKRCPEKHMNTETLADIHVICLTPSTEASH